MSAAHPRRLIMVATSSWHWPPGHRTCDDHEAALAALLAPGLPRQGRLLRGRPAARHLAPRTPDLDRDGAGRSGTGRLRPGRAARRPHVSFGAGERACPASELAREHALCVLRVLADLVPDAQPDDRGPAPLFLPDRVSAGTARETPARSAHEPPRSA